MTKYTLTTAGDLQAGDTFYKANDDSEIVYTVLDLPCRTPGKLYVRKGDLHMTDIMSKKQNVIFLTSKNIK